MKSLFRVLVILSSVLCFIGNNSYNLSTELYKEAVEKYHGYDAFFDPYILGRTMDITYYLYLIIPFLLFFHIRYSRELFCILYLFCTVRTLFQGTSILNPIEVFTFETSTFIDGMIITLAYLSPIKELFLKTQTQREQGA